jgi:hypothetical protein
MHLSEVPSESQAVSANVGTDVEHRTSPAPWDSRDELTNQVLLVLAEQVHSAIDERGQVAGKKAAAVRHHEAGRLIPRCHHRRDAFPAAHVAQESQCPNQPRTDRGRVQLGMLSIPIHGVASVPGAMTDEDARLPVKMD